MVSRGRPNRVQEAEHAARERALDTVGGILQARERALDAVGGILQARERALDAVGGISPVHGYVLRVARAPRDDVNPIRKIANR